MFFQFLTIGAEKRLFTLLMVTVVTCAAIMGLPKLQVDTGFSGLMAENDPDLPVYKQVVREFGSDKRIFIYVRDQQLWTSAKLAALEDLHYALDSLDFVRRVDDLFTLRSIRGTGDRIDSRLILTEAPPDRATIEKARNDASYNPLVSGHFLSEDGRVTAIIVSLKDGAENEHSDPEINESLERTLSAARSVFQQVFQVGGPRINVELRDVLFEDLKKLGPLSALVLMLAILFFLKSGFAALSPLITSGMSIVWTFGLMGWVGIPLNILSAMLPSLVIAVGSTEDTHMITAYFQGVSLSDEENRAAAVQFMLRHMGVPLVLTILTTALGFASNIFSSMGIIRHFAIASTIAIVANGIITIWLLPLLLSVMGPKRVRRSQVAENESGLAGVFIKLFDYTQRKFPGAILFFTAVVCGFFIYQLSRLQVTNDPLSYFQSDRQLIREINAVHRDLSGLKVFFIHLASEDENAFLEPKNIEKLVAIQRFLKKQEVFDSSLSLADYLSLVNREYNGGDESFFRPPPTRKLVAQFLLLFHRSDIQSYVSHDLRRANIVVRHNISDSNTLNRHVRELRKVVAHLAGNELKANILGENLMINSAAERLMTGQVKSLAVLLLVIFLLMSAMFTSFKGGLISLIPNLIPIILMFGVMGLLEIPLNPGTAMVAVIAVGIAIDGTIHLFARYNDLCRRTSDYEAAVKNTVSQEAIPMVATSFALAVGFGILLVSDFTVIAQFGALSAATMMFALFANLLITPIIMTRIRLIGLYQILAMSMHKDLLDKCILFDGMTPYQMRKAIVISELNEFDEGELVVEQGTVGRSMYLILSGEVQVVRRNNGQSLNVAKLSEGDVFGEIGYTHEIRRTADIRASTAVETLRFDSRKIQKDLKFFPNIVAKLNFNISIILGKRLAEVMENLALSDVENDQPPVKNRSAEEIGKIPT